MREYWIVDPRPNRTRADFSVLDERGVYQPVPVVEGIYHSTVLPYFWLNIAWLWAADLNPLAALAEIVGMDQLIRAIQEGSQPQNA